MGVRVLRGHAVEVLKGLPPRSVHGIVTSPPYYRARRYGTEPQVWPNPDGTAPCAGGAHEWDSPERTAARFRNGRSGSTLNGVLTSTNPQKTIGVHELNPGGGQTCLRCGWWLGELGWEATVSDFVAHLVQVFEAARHVLRDDGSLWVNIAGGYANEAGGQNGSTGGVSARAVEANRQAGRTDKTGGLPKLNYLDVPGDLGRAMQRAGWIWRSDTTLCKDSPLPDSVGSWRWERHTLKTPGPDHAKWEAALAARMAETGDGRARAGADLRARRDAEGWEVWTRTPCAGCVRCEPNQGLVLRRDAWRPTRATEALLLFVKQERYYSDQESVRVPPAASTLQRMGQNNGHPVYNGNRQRGFPGAPQTKNPRQMVSPSGRNPWNWMKWPNAGGFAGAHYAAYPVGLPSWCIQASVPEKACGECGAAWARIVESRRVERHELPPDHPEYRPGRYTDKANGLGGVQAQAFRQTVTLGWRPTCRHAGAPSVPGVVLDMFGGSGTTAVAAAQLGRECWLVDLNPEYTEMQEQRLAAVSVAAPATESESPPGRQLALFAEAGE